MDSLFEYINLCFSRAITETLELLGWNMSTAIIAVAVLMFGAAAFFKEHGKEATKGQLKDFGTWTLWPFLKIALIVFLVNLAFAPYLLYVELERHFSEELFRQIQSQLAPKDREISESLETIRRLQEENRQLQASTQVPVTLAPEPAVVRDVQIITQERVPSNNQNFPFGLRVIVQTNVAIQPVSIVFRCDGEIGQGDVRFAGDTGAIFIKSRSRILPQRPDTFLVSFEFPAFTPEKAMLVTLFSKTAIRVIEFSQVPFTFP